MTYSTLTFDETYETAVAISSVVMVCSGLWIVRVLIQIERSKVIVLSGVLEDDGTGEGELTFEESTSESRAKQLEVERADSSGGDIELSPTGKSKKTEKLPTKMGSLSPEKPMTARRARRKLRRVSWAFINIQIVSVLTLILLTYLLMVQSTAAVPLRVLGSLCVFAVFLRFQIGEEIRRQRVDRIMLLLSLFLLIASMMSTIVYSFKELSKGEIYEGPARIVQYDYHRYNNTKHDPTTRTDIVVSWGNEWGCSWSGGKVCEAEVQGAMCQSHPEKENTKHKPHYDTRRSRKRFLEDKSEETAKDDKKEDTEDEKDEKEEETDEVEEALEEDLEEEEEENQELEFEVDATEEEAEEVEEALEEDLEDEEKSNQDLEDENEDLEAKNEMLEKEIEELKEENEAEDEENNELVEQENSELNEVADEYNENIMIVEEEMYEDAQAYVDSEYAGDEEKLEDEIDSASDDATKEELTEELEEDKEDEEEVDEEYTEDEELLDEYADEYADLADEDYEDFKDAQDNTIAFEDEKEELKEEAEETEAEIEEASSKGGGQSSTDDLYEEFYEEEYEEASNDDEWYWDEDPDYYDDQYYEDEYWDYDWDSVWGDYACEDLFDADVGGKSYDPNSPAGGDDDWPFVNIYGSCKTCEAYILDYFAEEAFEETQEYKQQAIVYLAGAVSGFIWALLSYIKYKVSPTEENEIELLGNDGGVLA